MGGGRKGREEEEGGREGGKEREGRRERGGGRGGEGREGVCAHVFNSQVLSDAH